MENQQKYQPLLEKILESLEANKIDKQAGSQAAKYGLEVPTLESEAITDPAVVNPAVTNPRFVQHTPSNENSNTSPVKADPLQQDAGNIAEQSPAQNPTKPGPLSQIPRERPVTDNFAQTVASSFSEPFSEPLAEPFPETVQEHIAENYYEEAYSDQPGPTEPLQEETDARYLQPMDAQEQIPTLFHRDELIQQNTSKIPITKALYGLTGAIVVGAASVFYVMPELQTTQPDANKFLVAQSANKLFPGDNSSSFKGANLVSTDQGAISIGVTNESWEKGPEGNLVNNTGNRLMTDQEESQPKMFASINGPIDLLVNNIAKDLSVLNTQKPETFGEKEALNFDQTHAPAETLNQLEDSLENIINAASGELSPPVKKVVVAQATTNSAPAPIAKTDKMRALTDQVVSALSDLNAAENSNSNSLNQSVDHLRATLSDLVQEAENQGKGVKSVKHLLEEALGPNQQNLPAALKNKDGSLDISTLIASIVKRSDGETSTSSADADYLALIEDEGANAGRNTRILVQGNERYLIVQSGDTLSSIAYTTYGDAFAYPRIFNANKNLIKNPNSLTIGTRLSIPK